LFKGARRQTTVIGGLTALIDISPARLEVAPQEVIKLNAVITNNSSSVWLRACRIGAVLLGVTPHSDGSVFRDSYIGAATAKKVAGFCGRSSDRGECSRTARGDYVIEFDMVRQ